MLDLSVWDSAGNSHHTQAQQVAEMHLTKLQEQVSRAEWSGVCVTSLNLLTPHQLVCTFTGQQYRALQVLSGETALKAADKACKGRLAAVRGC